MEMGRERQSNRSDIYRMSHYHLHHRHRAPEHRRLQDQRKYNERNKSSRRSWSRPIQRSLISPRRHRESKQCDYNSRNNRSELNKCNESKIEKLLNVKNPSNDAKLSNLNEIEEIWQSDIWDLIDEVLADEHDEYSTVKHRQDKYVINSKETNDRIGTKEESIESIGIVDIENRNTVNESKLYPAENSQKSSRKTLKHECTDVDLKECKQNKLEETVPLSFILTEQSTQFKASKLEAQIEYFKSAMPLNTNFINKENTENFININCSILSHNTVNLENGHKNTNNTESMETENCCYPNSMNVSNKNYSKYPYIKKGNSNRIIPSNPQFVIPIKKIIKEWKLENSNEIDFNKEELIQIVRQALRENFLKILKEKPYMKSKEIMKLFRQKYPKEKDNIFISEIINRVKNGKYL